MKAIILAAGKGRRLKEMIDNIPKPMVKVKEKPILEHNIKWLRNYGIKDIYINIHHLPDVITNYFGNGSKWGVKLTYSYEPKLLGTAGAVRKILEEYWRHKVVEQRQKGIDLKPFLVVYGDNLFEYDLKEIIHFHKRKKGIATIALYKKGEVSQSGIAVLDNDNKILKFIEKPKPEEVVSHLVNTGLYVLEPDILDYIPSNKVLDFGKDVFPKMIQKGEDIFGVIAKGSLTAIDTPGLLKKALQQAVNGKLR